MPKETELKLLAPGLYSLRAPVIAAAAFPQTACLAKRSRQEWERRAERRRDAL
jgi:hypothetical protein